MTGDDNSFYGYRSGQVASTGGGNSFFEAIRDSLIQPETGTPFWNQHGAD